MGSKLPTSFLPKRIRLRVSYVQLPPAAALARTDEVLKKVEGILAKTEAGLLQTRLAGSACSPRVSASLSGLLLCQLKPGMSAGQ